MANGDPGRTDASGTVGVGVCASPSAFAAASIRSRSDSGAGAGACPSCAAAAASALKPARFQAALRPSPSFAPALLGVATLPFAGVLPDGLNIASTASCVAASSISPVAVRLSTDGSFLRVGVRAGAAGLGRVLLRECWRRAARLGRDTRGLQPRRMHMGLQPTRMGLGRAWPALHRIFRHGRLPLRLRPYRILATSPSSG